MNSLNHLIVLVEDSHDDVFFMRYALKKAQINYPVQVVADGQEAVDYLSGVGPYANGDEFPIPTVVFLDLKLPCLSGFEVLKWMRGQPALRQLPVYVLTGSSEDRDKERSRELGAQGYFVKPPGEAMLREVMAGLESPSPLVSSCAGFAAGARPQKTA